MHFRFFRVSLILILISADTGSGFDDESIASGFTDMTAVNRAPPATQAQAQANAAKAAKEKETAAKAAREAEKGTAAPPPPETTGNGAETPATADASAAAAAAVEEPVAEQQPEVSQVVIKNLKSPCHES